MASIDIYYMAESPPCRAIEMVANMVGVKLNKHIVNLFARENMKEDYVKLNPVRKIPFIVDGDLKINESCAIMTYLVDKYKPDDQYLYPKDPVERARVDELLFYAIGTLMPATYKLLRQYFFTVVKELNPDDEKVYNDVLEYLNKRLGDNGGKKFMLGDHLTVADIYLSTAFSLPDGASYDYRKYSHLVAYLERLKAAIPNYSEINDKPLENMKTFLKAKQEGK